LPAVVIRVEVITQPERLGALKAQVEVTEAEFAPQKAKLPGMLAQTPVHRG